MDVISSFRRSFQMCIRDRSQGNPYGGQGNPYGNQQGNPYGEWNPFEDIFGQFSGYYTNGGAQQRQKTTTGYEKDTHLRAAGNYVRNGYYQEARNVLDGMEPARRNARWYYYSAAANQGLGNNVTAMEHAKQAVSMEPDNYEYQMLLQQLQGNGSWYQQRQSTYQNPYSTGGDWCMKMCMLNLMCNCCCLLYTSNEKMDRWVYLNDLAEQIANQ